MSRFPKLQNRQQPWLTADWRDEMLRGDVNARCDSIIRSRDVPDTLLRVLAQAPVVAEVEIGAVDQTKRRRRRALAA